MWSNGVLKWGGIYLEDSSISSGEIWLIESICVQGHFKSTVVYLIMNNCDESVESVMENLIIGGFFKSQTVRDCSILVSDAVILTSCGWHFCTLKRFQHIVPRCSLIMYLLTLLREITAYPSISMNWGSKDHHGFSGQRNLHALFLICIQSHGTGVLAVQTDTDKSCCQSNVASCLQPWVLLNAYKEDKISCLVIVYS